MDSSDSSPELPTEFSTDELAPIDIHETTFAKLAGMRRRDIQAHLERHGVYFVMGNQNGRRVVALVIPTSFPLLIQVRDILRDTTKFTAVTEESP